MKRIEEEAQKWLRANGWDFQKYRDRRQDRSASGAMMNYEISPLLVDAFLAGAVFMRDAAAKACEREARSFREQHSTIDSIAVQSVVPKIRSLGEDEVKDA